MQTEVIAGEGMILTAGGIDAHVHFICAQLGDEAIASGVTTLLGGGTGAFIVFLNGTIHRFAVFMLLFTTYALRYPSQQAQQRGLVQPRALLPRNTSKSCSKVRTVSPSTLDLLEREMPRNLLASWTRSKLVYAV